MDFTNINDPAGVKALLDQLRTSQAWQDSVASGNRNEAVQNPLAQVPVPPSEPPATQPSTTIASLLSQLQAPSSPTFTSPGSTLPEPRDVGTSTGGYYPAPTQDAPVATIRQPSPAPPARKQDVRWLSFQQSLPHLARLGNDPSFALIVAQKMKQEQADLESQLHEERKAILRKHEEKVKLARTKANIVGGLSRHEADMMSDAFRKELRKFDLERALTAWDGLVTKQQAVLEGLDVPGMFITDASADRERQQRIIQVLEGIASGDAS
ncbi:hypothetical protein NEOLEDRAFT_1061790 [Neolentinus lepideus HHB14362 ss-1]|uniref:Uncharacterized protein n=1 Tax=Neolentinus lepideus HHB14362 ss-1 TaxID=1314782 RepID=A0A165TMN9_9AGAM|nr:hypothetical protein NEOLEDRAFT_1061790 [Neolentinus lepideus HHB14362 ss-1]